MTPSTSSFYIFLKLIAMQCKNILILVSITLCFNFTLFGQQNEKPLPELTQSLKLRNCTGNYMTHLAATISYLNENNLSVEDFGKYIGAIYAKDWTPGAKNEIDYFIEGYHWNMHVFPAYKMQILNRSESKIDYKVKRNWYQKSYLNPPYQLSEADLQAWLENLWSAVAGKLGLSYSQSIEDNWIMVKVSK